MSTVKVVNVQHPSASTAAVTLAADGSMTGSFPAPNRNLLYNGAMQVAQRGTSSTGFTGGGVYLTADRWSSYLDTAGIWTQTVENDAPTGSGLRKSLKVLCTTANGSLSSNSLFLIRQILEGQDVQRIAKGTASAQQLTVSFWVKSNVTGTYVARLYDYDNNRNVSATYSVSASATWERKTITFPADTTGALDNDNASSLQIGFFLAAGSGAQSGSLQTSWGTLGSSDAVGQTNLAAATNNYWQITGVQLEVGPVATAFEFKSFGQELRECQRYYFRYTAAGLYEPFGHGVCTSTTNAAITIKHPVTMRSATSAFDWSGSGTIVINNGSVGNTASAASLSFAGINGTRVDFTTTGVAAGNPAYAYSNNSTTSYVGLSAEL